MVSISTKLKVRTVKSKLDRLSLRDDIDKCIKGLNRTELELLAKEYIKDKKNKTNKVVL